MNSCASRSRRSVVSATVLLNLAEASSAFLVESAMSLSCHSFDDATCHLLRQEARTGPAGRGTCRKDQSPFCAGIIDQSLGRGRIRAKKSGLVIAARAATSNPVSQVLW